MKNVRSILALALVIAMTFTMLPVFAMAEDAAVEDVSVISEAAPAEAPAAIETAPAEAVVPAAELQALTNGSTSFANDAAAVAAGYFLRLDIPTVGSAWYNSFQTASNDYCTNNKADSAMVLLCDYTYYSDAAASSGIINCSAKDGTGTLTNLTFDLNGFTLTARCKRPVISRGSQCTNWMKFRGGTIFYQNLGETGRRGVAYSNAGYPTNNAGSAIMVAATELTDMNVICLAPANGGYATPIFSSNHWLGTVNATDSMLISVAGPAVEFKLTNTWKSDTSAAQINKIKNSGIQNSNVNLYGACVVGTLSDGPAVQFDYPATVTTNELQVGLIVNADDARESVFLGSSIVGVKDDPDNSARLMKTLPEDYTATASFALTLPDPATLASASSCAAPGFLAEAEYPAIVHAHSLSFEEEIPATAAERGTKAHYRCDICGRFYQDDAGMLEATAEWLMIPALACDHAAKQYVAEVPATVTETGVREHYFCPNCGKLLDMDGESERTLEALTIPTVACTHLNPEHRPAVPATFLATGVMEYWYCPTCGNCYADEACQTQISEDELTTPVRAMTDTEGLTDAQLVEYGAIFKTVAPDGTVTVFDTPRAAYTEGGKWTEPGGQVVLLRDYTYTDGSIDTLGLFDYNVRSKTTNNAWQYANADDPSLKGFWFDLGGHTFIARTGRPLFAPTYSLPVNIRNGVILYQNTAATAINYGVFKNGATTARLNSETEMYRPVYTLENVTLLRAKIAKQSDFNSSGTPRVGVIFHVGAWQSEFNIRDCTIINGDAGATCFRYLKSSPSASAALDAFAASKGYQHTINLSGSTVIGAVADAAIYQSGTPNGNSGEDADYFRVNVEGDNVKFVGTGIVSTMNADLRSVAELPGDYFSPSETYSVHMPNVAMLPTLTGPFDTPAGFESTPTEITQWVRANGDVSVATFTPDGGGESAQTTLTEAIQAWIANGYSGTVKLLSDVNEASSVVMRNTVGGEGAYYTTASETNPVDAMILLPATASGGNLTLDLGGHAITTKDTFLCMDAAVNGFDLSIQNGTVTMNAAKPLIVLKGAAVNFTAEGATLACLSTSSSNPIMDARFGGSGTEISNSTISSASRAAILIYTTSETGTDGSLQYNVTNSVLSTTGGAMQNTIHALSTLGSVYRPVTFILEGVTKLVNDRENGFCDLRVSRYRTFSGTTNGMEGNLYTLTTDGPSKLTTPEEATATVVSGGETYSFTTLGDALEYAELFGRSNANTTVTLNKDAVVTESKIIGEMGATSAFTLDLNGKTVSGEAIMEPDAGIGTEVVMTVTGAFGDGATSARFFAHTPAVPYADGSTYVIRKGSLFTNYSLNLEDNVSINLYTDGENGEADAVSYVQDGTEYVIAAPGALHEWVVDTLAAKEMAKTVDAYAVKSTGTTTFVDVAKGVSVMGYVGSDPAAGETNEAIASALNATLDTMLIYGKYAEKFFGRKYTVLSADELAEIGVAAIPETDVSNLAHADRVVTGMDDHTADVGVDEGFWGTAAVLEDAIGLKFYFCGAAFDGAAATVDGEAAELQQSGDYKFVQAAIAAKDFDKAVTVEIAGVGSVSDSAEAYTARVAGNDDTYNLVQALRAYCADAKRYAEAKTGA